MLRLTQTLLALCLLPHAGIGQRISAFVGYPFGWDISVIPEGLSTGATQVHPGMIVGASFLASDTSTSVCIDLSWEQTQWTEKYTYWETIRFYTDLTHTGVMDMKLRTLRIGVSSAIPVSDRVRLKPGISVGFLANAFGTTQEHHLYEFTSPTPSSSSSSHENDAGEEQRYYTHDLNRASAGVVLATSLRIGKHWEAGANFLVTFHSVSPSGFYRKPKYFQFTLSRDIVNFGNKKG